jgi:hypothetical protein
VEAYSHQNRSKRLLGQAARKGEQPFMLCTEMGCALFSGTDTEIATRPGREVTKAEPRTKPAAGSRSLPAERVGGLCWGGAAVSGAKRGHKPDNV